MATRTKGVYRREDGRYEARFPVGTKPDGRKQYRSVYGKTRAEASEKMRAALKNLDSGPAKTVSEVLRAHMEARANTNKPSTQATYRGYLDKHIQLPLGSIRCDRLTPQQCQRFVDTLLTGGLSVNAVRAIFSFVKSGLKHACLPGALEVEFPKSRQAGVTFLSAQEQRLLEAAALETGGDDEVSAFLGLYTAIRIGELCGLMWEDVDFETKTLYIRRTFQRVRVAHPAPGGPKTKLMSLLPKTESSDRSIPLPPLLLALLRRHKARSESSFVISCEDGPVEPRTLQYRFKKLLERAGVRAVNFHATRHTFVVRALEQGVDAKTISEILGHASPTITMKRYAHTHEDHKRKKLEELTNRIQGAGWLLEQ
jgi:integrase